MEEKVIKIIIDKTQADTSIKSVKKFQNKINLKRLTNESILKTFHRIKKDQNPFCQQKGDSKYL